MSNRDVRATWEYHNATKHSEQSLRAGSHFLDWVNQPILYKIYSSLEPIPLPGDFPLYTVSALDAIAAGKLYLAAYALRSGATGLTFFDDDVTAFFSPHSANKSVMFLIALGQPMKRSHA